MGVIDSSTDRKSQITPQQDWGIRILDYKNMELIMIRHGLPLRVERSDGSAADPELSGKGIEQAKKLASWMRNESLDALYCSPMMRAMMTAGPLAQAKGLEIQIEPDVAEYDRDASTYIPIEEIKEKEPERWKKMLTQDMDASINSFQDKDAFVKKVLDSLEKIVKENRGKKVAVVCHGGVVNVWASHVLEMNKTMFFLPEYTSINRFMASSSGVITVKSLNEAAHLREDLVS
jgi:probable phosphoglycerate mutase